MATCPRQKCVPRQMTTVLRWCFDFGVRSKVSRPMGSAASSRSLGEYKIDVTWQRRHRRVLDDIKEIGIVERANGTVQAQLRACFLHVQERMKSENHYLNRIVSMDVVAFRVVRWCATSPIRKDKKMYARVSAGTIRRSRHGEDCKH